MQEIFIVLGVVVILELVWLAIRRKDTSDPVYHCPVYRDKKNGSCAHVDGPLCDMNTCTSLKHYQETKKEDHD